MASPSEAPLPRRTSRKGGRRVFAGSTEKPTTTTSGAGGGAGAAAPPKPAVAAAAVRAKSDGEEEVVEFIDFDSTPTASKERNYEYLDHTADIQLHAWGVDRKEAFARVAVAMFGYMTDLDTVSIDPSCNRSIKCKGHDAMSLLYSFLDEMLYTFCSDDFVAKEVAIVAVDWDAWTLTASAKGEKFDLKKHPQGTEVKAITYSAMQIHAPEESEDGLYHVYVIVDI